MGRKEKLLKKLKSERFKLELRKKRFELWEVELVKKDEEGKATAEDVRRENMFWRKGRRIADRINFIDDKIFELEKDDCFLGILKGVFSKWKSVIKQKII